MIRVGSGFVFKSSHYGCTLTTNPFKRIQFGITAGLLFAGLLAAIGTGSVEQTSTPGFMVFLLFFLVSLGVAGYRKNIQFNVQDKKVTIAVDLFFIPLGKHGPYSYTSEAEIKLIRIDFFQKGVQPRDDGFEHAQAQANKKSLVKLMFHTGEKALFLDESSVYGEAELLATQLSNFLSIPVSSA